MIGKDTASIEGTLYELRKRFGAWEGPIPALADMQRIRQEAWGMQRTKIGGIYQHYKGDLYLVILMGWESTDPRPRRPVVIYVSLKEGQVDTRDEDQFHQFVVPRLRAADGSVQPAIDPDEEGAMPRFKLIGFKGP